MIIIEMDYPILAYNLYIVSRSNWRPFGRKKTSNTLEKTDFAIDRGFCGDCGSSVDPVLGDALVSVAVFRGAVRDK